MGLDLSPAATMLVGVGADATSGRDARIDDLGVTRLGDSLERFVHHLGAPPISILTQLNDRWPEVVGPGLAVSTRPIELVNGVLTVACDDAAWAAQIGWMSQQIIDRFSTTFNSDLVERVASRVEARA